jgi:hypothetical protein
MKNTIDSSRVTRLGLADVVDRALARAVRSVLLAAPRTLELLEPRTLLTAAPLGQEFLVNQRDLGGEATQEPAVAMDLGGDSVVVWVRSPGTGSENGIFARRYEQTAPATASVGDRVWLDEDGNGVQDAGESGVMGVSVDLLDEDGVVASTVTDYRGYYDFDGLPAGDSYYLRFNLPQGYVFSPQDQGAHDALDSDANVETGKTTVFMLWPGVADMTHDAGM